MRTILADKALADEGAALHWQTEAPALVSVHREEVPPLVDGNCGRTDPGVAEAGRAAHRRVDTAADPDRRPRFTLRADARADVGQLEVLTMVGDPLLGPQALDHVECLSEAGDPLLRPCAHHRELLAAVAESHRKDEVAVGDPVEGRRLLGRHDWIQHRQQRHSRPDQHALSLAGEPCEQGYRLVHSNRREHHVLAHEQ